MEYIIIWMQNMDFKEGEIGRGLRLLKYGNGEGWREKDGLLERAT